VHAADDDGGGFAIGEIAEALGGVVADNPFLDMLREMRREAWKEYIANLPNPKQPRRKPKGPRQPSIDRLVKQFEKATGKPVTSIAVDGVTLTSGDMNTVDDVGRELAEFEARHGKA
jgi:hypothetical protein